MVARILICEDNKPNLDLMVYLLANKGYTVLTAMDGEAGLFACENERPDLFICDIQLPKMDGFEIIRRLKTEKHPASNVPVIAITAYAMVGDREKILATGCNGYIAKPINPETFVQEIEHFIVKDLRVTGKDALLKKKNAENTIQSSSVAFRGTVLVVDDNVTDRYLSEMLLKTMNLRPILAGSVEEAMGILQNIKPDMILSDYHLPDKTGGEFLKFLQSSEQFKHICFLMISSSIPPEQFKEISSQIGDIIYRPIEPRKFIDIIEKIWQQHFH
jgi:two-component system cell cycle response regulator